MAKIDKCVNLYMNVEEATYLGNTMNKKTSVVEEVEK